MFDIDNTLSFNTDLLVEGNEYDYVTRTSYNQGVLQSTGFVNSENINPAGTWSLGLLQMDFFYRPKCWYAGQFVRKITPKINIPQGTILFFTTILNKQKPILLSVLVRNVDETFRSIEVNLPVMADGQIDFEFMESFVAELEAERVAELSAYLKVSGLENYELSKEEEKLIKEISNIEFKGFDITDIFDIYNTHNILSRDIVEGSGMIPYLCASSENNSISSYIAYQESFKEKGNCVFIGGKTFVVTYQKDDFFSNDSHNLALYLKCSNPNRLNQLYLVTCIYKSLAHKYSWGDSVSKTKIKKDKLFLPTINGKPDYELMERIIKTVQKLVVKDVVQYAERKISATK